MAHQTRACCQHLIVLQHVVVLCDHVTDVVQREHQNHCAVSLVSE